MEEGRALAEVDEGMIVGKVCVKCSEPAKYSGIDPKKAVYCRSCFVQMVRNKFRSSLSKRRIFRDGEPRETLVVYDGTISSSFLLHQIEDAVKQISFKRLMISPTILILASCMDDKLLEGLVERVGNLKKLLPESIPWIIAHVSTGLCRDITSTDCTGFVGLDQLPLLRQILSSCKTPTAQDEIKRILAERAVTQIAKSRSITKIMMPDDADTLGSLALAQLCIGRGYVVADLTDTVDKRPSGITFIRPLRDISQKELAIVSYLEGYANSTIQLEPYLDRSKSKSIHAVSSGFVSNLIDEGYKATISTILSTASKLNSPPAKFHCPLCQLASVECDSVLCSSCDDILNETKDSDMIKQCLL